MFILKVTAGVYSKITARVYSKVTARICSKVTARVYSKVTARASILGEELPDKRKPKLWSYIATKAKKKKQNKKPPAYPKVTRGQFVPPEKKKRKNKKPLTIRLSLFKPRDKNKLNKCISAVTENGDRKSPWQPLQKADNRSDSNG